MKNIIIRDAQRVAIDFLNAKGTARGGKFAGRNITAPAHLQQELAYAATTTLYTFRFGADAPVGTTALNNILLGDNDSYALYGIQVLFGYNSGVDRTNRVYRPRGVTPSDDALYNGLLSFELESSKPVELFSTHVFRSEETPEGDQGLVLVNPVRFFTGRVSKVNLVLDLEDISGLTLTANSYILVRLHGALGRA